MAKVERKSSDGQRVAWLVDKLEALEVERRSLMAKNTFLDGQVRALSQRVLGDDPTPSERNAATITLVHSTLRKIVNNPTSRRDDVQGILLDLLNRTGGFDA